MEKKITGKVTSGGRFTIPAEMRKKYNITPGTVIKFRHEGDYLICTPQHEKA